MPNFKDPVGGWKAFAGLVAMLLLLTTAQMQPVVAQTNGSDSTPSEQEIYTHYSLYWEDLKNEDYASALPNLRWILEHAPAEPGNDDRNFRRAIDLYAGLAEETEDEATVQAYLDTAYTLLSDAPERLERLDADYSEYQWTLRKGRFLQQYVDQMPDVDEDPIAYYEEAFELDPERLQAYYIDRILAYYTEAQDQQQALAFIDQVEAERGGDEEAMEVIDKYRDDIFDRNPRARITFLEQQMEENPDDPDVVGDLFELYLDQGQRDQAEALSEKLLGMEPSIEDYRLIAEMRLDDGEAAAALEIYQRAETEAGATFEAQDYYNMGEAEEQMDNPEQARSYYRQALEQDPGYGDAYIAIGDLYVQAVSDCGGSQMGRGDRAVYWLAVDMYQQARSVDESVASTADQKIQTYSQYFPSAEDIFYRDDMQVGESFRVDYDCYAWISETTTVRRAS